MARKKRKRKSKSSNITYDSKETKTVLGLLSILLGIILFLAAFIDVTDENFFTVLQGIFGQTTVVAGFFFFNLGLLMFESRLPFANKTSVISQLILMLLVPAFLTSLHGSKEAALLASTQGLSGGELGYLLAYKLFADSLVFAQFTPLFLGIACLIFIPIAFSMSVSKLLEIIEKILKALFNFIKGLLGFGRDQMSEEEMGNDEFDQHQPSRFSDFKRDEIKPEFAADDDDYTPPSRHDDNSDVTISEKAIGEEGLSFSELKYPNWQLPPLSLLTPYRKSQPKDTDKERNTKIIEQTLGSFNIDAKVVESYVGPSVVQYALDIPLGVKVAKIATLAENIALALGVDSKAVRIESIPGTTYLGIEVPRSIRDVVRIKELMEAEEMQNSGKNLPVPIGKDIDGGAIVGDIQKMPHLLIAGATGSGKSILTNSFIASLLLLRTPDELKLILVDPKKVELSDYNGIPHLLTPVITDMEKVVNALKWAVTEMDKRYDILAEAQVRNIEGYNQKIGFAAMPYIVIVIDEMADMMMTANRNDTETAIVRLAQKARAVGIHLILATQRPSVNVITGIIKANIPGRIGMSVTSSVDSRVILDAVGAESLMGQGDLLFKAPDKTKSIRLQSPLISQEEVGRIVKFIKSQVPEVEYASGILEEPSLAGAGGTLSGFSTDDMFPDAVRTVVDFQKGSSSFLQRKLNIGFNRAARLLEEMEEAGVVGPAQGSKPREVLISDAEDFLRNMQG